MDRSRGLVTVLRRPMVAAVVTAGMVVAVLAVVVLGPLTSSPEGTGGERRTAIAVAAVATATATPQPPTAVPPPPEEAAPTAPPAEALEPTATAVPPTAPPTVPPAPPTATQAPPTATAAATATPLPSPSPTATTEALYAADGQRGFDGWPAGGSWRVDGGVLVNAGEGVESEPVLVAPYRPGEDYAIEAEIRVRQLASGRCDQSFGLVGSGTGGVAWGGGLIWKCNDDGQTARITNVSDYVNGYNLDPELAAKGFTVGTDWRTYRLEVRGDRLRFLVDGETILEATDPAPGGAGDAVVGLWSQGVGIEVRRIAVVAA